ncbi:MAG: class I SAM-dependent methyltransferase [Rhodobacteraceae bacterium]|nr:class I SAM-dependent methyltransferase [Paracoccaceae bacterium]
MTPLVAEIAAEIRVGGPITLARYMGLCLSHPRHGYYTTHDPLGAGGDFITAPEISQMFGELVGLALAQAWQDQGAPARAHLVELGPGRGTLMADILRATNAVPGFRDAVRITLIETSPALKQKQADTLADYAADWTDDIANLTGAPLFVVANEFFDALPIRQFQRAGAAWAERVVGLSATGTLAPGLSPAAQLAALDHRLADTEDGDIVETCEPGAAIAGGIGAHIAAHGGAALIFDYGDWRSQGDTLQALRGHAAADPFAAPGQADLTAHVDFEPLADAARIAGATPSRLTPQGVFLERLGITARAEALARGLQGARRANHIAAHRRLTHPAEMGALFKVMGIAPHGAPPVAGLEQ